MIDFRGIKTRPRDLDVMLAHGPSLVEMHCSISDLKWMPPARYDIPLALHAPEFSEDGELLDPASLDEKKRKRAQDILVHAGGRASAWAMFFMGDPLLVFHPGGASPGTSDEDPARNAARADALGRTIAAVKAAVAGSRVDVLLENLPRSCWFFGGAWKANMVTGGAELAALGKRYGAGVTLDLCHLFLACNELGLDFLAEVQSAADSGLVRHVHYSDASGTDGEGLQIGEGTLPLADAFAILNRRLAADVIAVPEIWFGHENGGSEFVRAWRRMEALSISAGVTA